LRKKPGSFGLLEPLCRAPYRYDLVFSGQFESNGIEDTRYSWQVVNVCQKYQRAMSLKVICDIL